MVCYLSESGKGIKRYAELDSGVMDVQQESPKWGMRYLQPDKVHPSALKENVSVRQQGYWVSPETMPKQYLWANGDQALPDVMPGFIVSPRFKELVEEFESGVHQFVPIDVFKERNGAPVETYYWFIVGQRLDSVDRAHTTYQWRAAKDHPDDGRWIDEVMDTATFEFTPIPGAKLVFGNSQIAGHHIWHDPHLLTSANGLCSDEFARTLQASGMTGVAITPRESI